MNFTTDKHPHQSSPKYKDFSLESIKDSGKPFYYVVKLD